MCIRDRARRRQLLKVKPNDAHIALARLQANAEHFTLITQNVDDLHERGGCTGVLHMHGQLRTLRCEASGQSEVRMDGLDLTDEFLTCTCCEEPSRLRPDIVWFGEVPMKMADIYDAVEACDLFIVVGSSGHVYPAANLVHCANQNGAHTVLVNLEHPINSEAFEEVHIGKAGEILPALVEKLIAKKR